jgi:hypothetical protein
MNVYFEYVGYNYISCFYSKLAQEIPQVLRKKLQNVTKQFITYCYTTTKWPINIQIWKQHFIVSPISKQNQSNNEEFLS